MALDCEDSQVAQSHRLARLYLFHSWSGPFRSRCPHVHDEPWRVARSYRHCALTPSCGQRHDRLWECTACNYWPYDVVIGVCGRLYCPVVPSEVPAVVSRYLVVDFYGQTVVDTRDCRSSVDSGCVAVITSCGSLHRRSRFLRGNSMNIHIYL